MEYQSVLKFCTVKLWLKVIQNLNANLTQKNRDILIRVTTIGSMSDFLFSFKISNVQYTDEFFFLTEISVISVV